MIGSARTVGYASHDRCSCRACCVCGLVAQSTSRAADDAGHTALVDHGAGLWHRLLSVAQGASSEQEQFAEVEQEKTILNMVLTQGQVTVCEIMVAELGTA